MTLIEQSGKRLITQDNQIIEACFTMTLLEKRLLLLALSKINPELFPEASKPLVISVDVKEWAKYYSEINPWRDIRRAAVTLLGRHVTFHPKEKIIDKINWFAKVSYHQDEGWLTLEFTRPMQVRLAGMLEKFTQIDLFSVRQLTRVHSIRLYEILSQFKSTGFRNMIMEDFRFAMDCVNSYQTTKALKQFVLNPAVKEINAKSNFYVTVEDVKKGRRITGFKFDFKEKNKAIK